MAIALKSSCFLQLKKPETDFNNLSFSSNNVSIISAKRYTSVSATANRTIEAVSISETFNSLKKQGKATPKPVAVGFGISTAEQVKQVAGWGADGVIVGSAMVKLLGEAKTPQEGLKELENFTLSLRSALD